MLEFSWFPPSLVLPLAVAHTSGDLLGLSCGKCEMRKLSWEISREHFISNSLVSGEGNGTPLQYSCLENPMGGAAVHEVAKSQTRLSDFTLTFHFRALEKERATHSSVLAWRIPGMGEPGGLPSMGSYRVGHWSESRTLKRLSSSSFVSVVLQLCLRMLKKNSEEKKKYRLNWIWKLK